MIQISVKADTRAVEAALKGAQKQIPFALARALTMVARQSVDDLRTEMKRVFRNPTNFTLNAFYAKPARKTDLTAWVGAREYASKGTPASKYLLPEVVGGARGLKRLELRIGAQALGTNRFVIPGRGALLDGNGNWSRQQIGQMLSQLGAFTESGQNISEKLSHRLRRAKMTVAASGHKSSYFIARSKSDGSPIGIWKLISKGVVEPVAIFAKNAPTYSKLLDVQGTVTTSVNKHWTQAVSDAVEQALATAK